MLDFPMEQLTLSCYDVELLVVDAAGVGICRCLLDTLPPQFVAVSSSGSPSATYRVEAVTRAGRPAWRVTRDGDTLVCEEGFASDLPHYLRQDIDRCVAQQASRMLFVHAGVVGWRGHAIVILGRSHTGKSTLVADLVRRGAVYYSDEYAVLDDQGRVHPYSRTPVFRDDGTAADLRLVREDEPLDPLPLALIVAGDYRDGTAWRPTVVRGARAVLPLIDGTVLAREESASMLRIAACIGRDVIALMGPRPDAAEVAPQLLELVDDAIVSRGLAREARRSGGLAPDLAGVAERRFQSREVRRPPTDRRLCAARYLRMLDFLSPDEHQRLLKHALACQDDFHESGIVGNRGESTLDYGARRSRTLMKGRLEEAWHLFEGRLNGMLPGVRKALGTPYLPTGERRTAADRAWKKRLLRASYRHRTSDRRDAAHLGRLLLSSAAAAILWRPIEAVRHVGDSVRQHGRRHVYDAGPRRQQPGVLSERRVPRGLHRELGKRRLRRQPVHGDHLVSRAAGAH